MISVDDIKTWITTQSSAIPQLLYFKNKRTKLELADSVYSKNDIQTVNYEQLAFLGFVGEGLFHGLYWKKPYLCNRNREAEGSAQAGCSGMQRQIKEL